MLIEERYAYSVAYSLRGRRGCDDTVDRPGFRGAPLGDAASGARQRRCATPVTRGSRGASPSRQRLALDRRYPGKPTADVQRGECAIPRVPAVEREPLAAR